MRDIKFRAWDTRYNKWAYFPLQLLAFGDASSDAEQCVDWCQFTGLVDKNGKDIYEGDIVNILYTDWTSQDSYETGKVEWLEDCWVLNFGDTKSRWPGDDKGSIRAGIHGWIEVIGNIYENREILEKCYCDKKSQKEGFVCPVHLPEGLK